LLRSTVDGEHIDIPLDANNESGAWPPQQKDIIIEGLLRRCGRLDDGSLEIHGGVVCAVQLSDDLSSLSMCVPSFDSLFLRESFNQHFPKTSMPNEFQNDFIDAALRRKASHVDGPTVNHSDLDDIVALGRSWGLVKSQVLTQFLLVMYELGKDDVVDNLANSSTRLIEIETFLDGGIPIVCVRLNAAIGTLKKAKQCRSILAMLDADTCEWVKEQAVLTEEERPDRIHWQDEYGKLISLMNTHALILRIKRMSSVNRIDAYALSVMCETLLKAVEQFE